MLKMSQPMSRVSSADDPCLSVPCANGLCNSVGPDTFQCLCLPYYTGIFCDTSKTRCCIL